MLTVSFVFAVICFAFLLLFFTGVPNLRTCRLPLSSVTNEPDQIKNRLAVMLITLVYAVSAFWNLGNTRSPQTFVPMQERSVVMELREEQVPVQLVLFPGVGQGKYDIEYSSDAEGWFPLTTFTQDHVSVLKWQYLPLECNGTLRYMRIHCVSGAPWLGELMLKNCDGSPIRISSSIPELTDEQNLVPVASDYHNSSYFDEIYHARTAWEHLHRVWPYEISHPPLGKEMLSLGILLFGMTPFGWRFSGTLTGVLMLPLMYLFLRRLYGSGRIAVLGTVMSAAGFMHYVQTRIATVDSFAVFFILLMYFFMWSWLQSGKKRNLFFCGISFGMGAATKWICLYAGAGMGVIWLCHWILEAIERPAGFASRFLKNALLCILTFIAVPALIYYFSYLPYGIAENTKLFSRAYGKLVLDNQAFMFRYHAGVVAEHPYSSRWYQWLLNIRPILYYLEYLPEGRRISIAAFVNPVLSWGGFLSLTVLLYTALVRHDREAAFLLIAFASGIVPWMFISRLTFEYHYFASAAFLIPVICYVFALMERSTPHANWYSVGFTIASVLLFFVFFPVLNGLPVNNELATRFLAWLPSWPI